MSDLNGKVALVVDGGESQSNARGGSLSALLGPQGPFSDAA